MRFLRNAEFRSLFLYQKLFCLPSQSPAWVVLGLASHNIISSTAILGSTLLLNIYVSAHMCVHTLTCRGQKSKLNIFQNCSLPYCPRGVESFLNMGLVNSKHWLFSLPQGSSISIFASSVPGLQEQTPLDLTVCVGARNQLGPTLAPQAFSPSHLCSSLSAF